jgi:hypothetical protein
MIRTHSATAVREHVVGALVQFGLGSPDQVRESILIRHGAYCGRRFEGANGYAIWFADENQIKFFSADGRVMGDVQTPQIAPASRQAA